MKFKPLVALLGGMCLGFSGLVQAQTYTQNFDFPDGTQDLGDGTTVAGSIGGVATDQVSVQDGALQLTNVASTDMRGSFRIPGPGAETVDGFRASFRFLIANPAGNPADGFSFNYGAIPAFTEGQDVAGPQGHGAAEEGFGIGLSVEFDTYYNVAGEAGYNVAVNNVDVAGGFVNAEVPVDEVFHTAEILWTRSGDTGGFLTLEVDGKAIFTELPTPGFSPFETDIFAFSARTGGATETVLIDDLVIESPATTRDPAYVVNPNGLVFEPLAPSASGEGSLAIVNAGTSADLVIDSASLSGPDAASFSLVSTLPLTVPAGESVDLVVSATAGAASGSLLAYLDLTTNDSVATFQNITVPVRLNVVAPGETASHSQNFDSFDDGTTEFGDESVLQNPDGSAQVINNALRLTQDTVGGTQTYYYLPALGAALTDSFSATFDFSLESAGTPADGFSFNFGPIQVGEIGSEEGFGKGLSIEFDTYNNFAGEGGYNIAVDGIDVADGFIAELPPVDAAMHTAQVIWVRTGVATGRLSLIIDDAFFFEDLATDGFHPTATDVFAFAARTGGAMETLLVDNIEIEAPAAAAERDPFILTDRNVNFGSVDQGQTKDAVLVVQNAGETANLEISADSFFRGDDAAAFSFVTALPVTIAPGESEEIVLRVTASQELGNLEAQAVLVNNDSSEIAQERAVSLLAAVSVAGGLYEQNFDSFADGTTEFDDGSTLVRNDTTAQVIDGQLQLTLDGTGGTVSHFFLPSLGAPASQSFSASFDFMMEAGGTPADGFSFNFGPILQTDAGSEEGYGKGLSIEFDTYHNTAGEAGYNVAVNNVDVPGGFIPEVPFVDGNPHTVEIVWMSAGESTGRITVKIDDEIFFEELPTDGFTPTENDIFAFVARTGGAFETMILDNIRIEAPASVAVRDPYILTSRTVDFGVVAQGGTKEALLTITNDGETADLVISADSAVTGEGFSIVSELPLTIPPKESREITLSVTASQEVGQMDGTLTLVNNDSDETARNRNVNLTAAVALASGSYTQNFDGFADGVKDFGDGSTVTTNDANVTGVVDGALRLIEEGIGSITASYILPSLGQATTDIFIASFDFTFSGGSPADGMSLTYGNLPASGVPTQAAEEGWGNGLSIEFDAYMVGDAEHGYNVAVNNVDVPGGFINEDMLVDGEPHSVEILWVRTGASGGIVNILLDGEALFTDLPTPGFNPQPEHRFGFAARTGGATMTVLLDNVSVVGGTDDPNLLIGSASFGVISDSAPITRSLTVRNTGGETALNISSATIEPSGVFSVVSYPETIEPRGQGEIVIEIDPSMGAGLEMATLNLQSNDESNSTVSVALSASFPLSPDLLGYYKLDETSGTQMADSSGNGRHGNYIGSVTLGEASLATGSSVGFGVEGGLAYGQIPGFMPTQEVSVSMWVQQQEKTPDGIAALFSKKDNVGTGSAYALSIFENFPGVGPGTVVWTVGEDPNEPQLFVDGAIALDETAHIVLTHSDENGASAEATLTRLFVNGTLAGEVENPLGFVDEEGAFEIARVSDAIGFVGLIDDVQIYGRELTSDEVAELFTNPGTVIGVETPVEPTDSDGDGVTDEDEAIAGTDPNDPLDYLHTVSTVRTDDSVQLTWSSKAGMTYDIEYSLTMEAGSWTSIGTIEADGDLTSFSDEDEARTALSEGYYRAKVVVEGQ